MVSFLPLSRRASAAETECMMVLVVLGFFIALAIATALGLGVDSRDPSFSLFSRRDDIRSTPRS